MSYWNQPLPPNWEAKYDPGQARYFYINHVTKITTWTDPRITGQQQPQQPQPSPAQPRPAHVPHAGGYAQTQRQPHPQQQYAVHPQQHAHAQQQHAHAQQQHAHQQQQHAQRLQPSPQVQRVPSPQAQRRSPSPSPRPAQRAHSPQPSPSQGAAQMPAWQKEIQDKYQVKVNTIADDIESSDEETSSSAANEADAVSKLKKIFPTAEQWAIKAALTRSGYVLSQAEAELVKLGYMRQGAEGQRQDNEKVKKLKGEFPGAAEDVIRDVVQCVNHNEAKARQELKNLGYEQKSHAPSMPASMHHQKPKASAAHHKPKMTDAQKDAAKKITHTFQTSKRKTISDAQKAQMLVELKKEFNEHSPGIVQIALETCEYDKEKTRQVLKTIDTKASTTRKATSPRRTTGASSSSTSQGASAFSSGIPSYDITKSTVGSTGNTDLTVKFDPLIPPSSTTTHRATTPTRTAQPKKQPKKKGVAPKKTYKVRQPTTRAYTYAPTHKTCAVGPDHSLAHGPDSSLLLEYDELITGPDKENRCGPDWTLRTGPTGYYGPDHGLSKGPDRSIYQGHDPSLYTGPTVLQSSSRVLVTNV